MSLIIHARIECDAREGCDRHSPPAMPGLAPHEIGPTMRQLLKLAGWTTSTVDGRERDYCPEHSGAQGKQA